MSLTQSSGIRTSLTPKTPTIELTQAEFAAKVNVNRVGQRVFYDEGKNYLRLHWVCQP